MWPCVASWVSPTIQQPKRVSVVCPLCFSPALAEDHGLALPWDAKKGKETKDQYAAARYGPPAKAASWLLKKQSGSQDAKRPHSMGPQVESRVNGLVPRGHLGLFRLASRLLCRILGGLHNRLNDLKPSQNKLVVIPNYWEFVSSYFQILFKPGSCRE